ncbi:TetR/AcrR family transcriptional regulator [Lentzea sp. JNUCC 0626]|uniref:TetR/AcrR family transcriptional regulator n=1 Tax=Lentzea sp. JNUCC 0626 TaxID=3367513 RepID=UPI00374A3030
MTTGARRLRADAARNAERILRAARAAYAEIGPDVSLNEIADRAGVGATTLFRRFPNKESVARAAFGQCIAEEISPAIERALADDDPRHGMVTLMEAAVAMAAREPGTVGAARNAGAVSPKISPPFFEALTELAQRAQQAGRLRADLVPDDLYRIMVMVLSLLFTMDLGSNGWSRYISLVLEGLSPVGAGLLPPAVPLAEAPARSGG